MSAAAKDSYGWAHCEQIIQHLRVDASLADASPAFHAGREGMGIWISYSHDCPFDLWFTMAEEVWGADAYSLLKGMDLTIRTDCPTSETDASVVAEAITDAVKDFRGKHLYEKLEDGWHQLLPIS
jgi:hypothetical protein